MIQPERHRDLLTPALVSRQVPAEWSGSDWSLLLRQARAAGLLGRLAGTLTDHWPQAAAGHLVAARRVSEAQVREIHREATHIRVALASLGAPVVLLKGAAYVMLGLPSATGRSFSDIDLLVPKEALARAESLLMMAGWMSSVSNAYDQRYYRQWAQELPPMEHVHRETTIDVHHNLLPQTARTKPDADRLFEDLVPIPGQPGLYALSPADMVLHSMTHLFVNDDTSHALRDLSDIDLLLRHFGREASFWRRLLQRAATLNLSRHCHYGLHYAATVLKTPVPIEILDEASRLGPPARVAWLMHWVWTHVFRAPHAGARGQALKIARLLLLIRGHWLRMPPGLLVRHLTVKALHLHERGGAREPLNG